MPIFSVRSKTWVAGLTAFALAGCAGISPQRFYENPSAASDFEVCKALMDPKGDAVFVGRLREELARRFVPEGSCPSIIKKREQTVAAGIIAGLAVVAVAAAARNGGGGSASGGSAYAPTSDYDWEWDEFYGKYGTLVWACRGVQTAQFADMNRCAYKLKTDWKWPSKQAPV